MEVETECGVAVVQVQDSTVSVSFLNHTVTINSTEISNWEFDKIDVDEHGVQVLDTLLLNYGMYELAPTKTKLALREALKTHIDEFDIIQDRESYIDVVGEKPPETSTQ